jgi:hypothetical protein
MSNDREKLIERIGSGVLGWTRPSTQLKLRRAIVATLDAVQEPEFDAAVDWLINSGEVNQDALAQFWRIANGKESAP